MHAVQRQVHNDTEAPSLPQLWWFILQQLLVAVDATIKGASERMVGLGFGGDTSNTSVCKAVGASLQHCFMR